MRKLSTSKLVGPELITPREHLAIEPGIRDSLVPKDAGVARGEIER